MSETTEVVKLRPHHILDIIRDHGLGLEFEPCSYEHAVHVVAEMILSGLDWKTELIAGSDYICQPCIHLQPNGLCDDILNTDPPLSKQEYNDALDRRLFAYLGIAEGAVMTIREYLEIINARTPGIEAVCSHGSEDHARRLAGLVQGLIKLGIRDEDVSQ